MLQQGVAFLGFRVNIHVNCVIFEGLCIGSVLFRFGFYMLRIREFLFVCGFRVLVGWDSTRG